MKCQLLNECYFEVYCMLFLDYMLLFCGDCMIVFKFVVLCGYINVLNEELYFYFICDLVNDLFFNKIEVDILLFILYVKIVEN